MVTKCLCFFHIMCGQKDGKPFFFGKTNLAQAEVTLHNVRFAAIGKLENKVIKLALAAFPKVGFGKLYAYKG